MNYIKRMRREAGISQDMMAKLMGVSKSMVFLLEKGKREPSKDLLLRIATIQIHLHQKKGPKNFTGKDQVNYSNPSGLAEIHRVKMETHRKLAEKLLKDLEKIKTAVTKLETENGLRGAVQDLYIPGLKISRKQEMYFEIMRLDSTRSVKMHKNIEELQDKIDTHHAYASLHEQRWGMFLKLAVGEEK